MKTLSISVMAHESRANNFPYLRKMLGRDIFFAVDNGKYGVWENCKRAWRMYDKNAEYHVVIQDDAIIAENFKGQAESFIQNHANNIRAFNFYCGNSISNETKLKEWLEAGYLVSKSPVWGLAICLPTKLIPEMIEYCDQLPHAQDDTRIGKFIRHKGMEVIFPVPSLVDHRGSPSLVGVKNNPSRALCFTGNAGAVKRFSHAVIIRFHYPKGDPKFEWRFAYFRTMVLPRLLSQKNKFFDICIRCSPWHVRKFKALSPRIKTFAVKKHAEGMIRPRDKEKAKRYFIDFVEWEDVRGLPKYDIQTGFDSDDLVLRDDFIDRIEAEAERFRGQTLHISFQPFMFNTKDLRMYKAHYKYNPKRGSAFFSLYQPKSSRRKYVFAYDQSHLTIGQRMEKQVFIDEDYCAYSVHEANASTVLGNNPKPIWK